MLVTQPFQYKLQHLSLKLSTKVSLFWEIRPKAEVQTTSSHLPALMHRGGTYTRAQGRQLNRQNLHICNRETFRGWCIPALIRVTQKLNPFPLHLTSCHLTSQRRLRTSILSLIQQFNPADAENTSTDRESITPGSTRNRDGFGKRQFTAQYPTAAAYSCFHPSPLPYPLFLSSEKNLKNGYILGRSQRELVL